MEPLSVFITAALKEQNLLISKPSPRLAIYTWEKAWSLIYFLKLKTARKTYFLSLDSVVTSYRLRKIMGSYTPQLCFIVYATAEENLYVSAAKAVSNHLW